MQGPTEKLWWTLELMRHSKPNRIAPRPGRYGEKPHRIGAVGNPGHDLSDSAYHTRGAKVSIYF